MKKSLLFEYTSNTAAIASTFHENGLYDRLYETKGEKFGGFPGLWAFFAELGEAFTNTHILMKVSYDDYEYVDAIGLLCTWAADYHLDQVNNQSSDWDKVSERAITHARYSHAR